MEFLNEEFARTGCEGQSYRQETLLEASGPAFLIYYAPAFLQKNCAEDAQGALSVLVELMRQARQLWPLDASACGSTVTLRIDALKDRDPQELRRVPAGEFWSLQRTSSID